MNPRVSRSSRPWRRRRPASRSPKIAAKLAVGYTLDEIPNDITRETPASFEPTLDYVVVKVPRFAFEKFPGADPADDAHEERRRGDGDRPQLHRGAAEGAALARAAPTPSFDWRAGDPATPTSCCCRGRGAARRPAARRAAGPAAGATVEELHDATGIDPWFLDQLELLNEVAAERPTRRSSTADLLRRAKRHGFSDAQIAGCAA